MQSKFDFEQSITEIDWLNSQSKNESKQRTNNEKIYYKAIVLLLCAKLEKFVKDSANEYYKTLLSYKLSADKWPENFILEILDNEIDLIKEKTIKNYKNKIHVDLKKNLSLFWDEKYVIKNLHNTFSISISNNGTTEFKKAYKKIGYPDIIEQLKEFEQVKDNFGIKTRISISIVDTINKVINMRHNIIHDDACPPITEEDIDKYIEVFKSFVEQIDEKLSTELKRIKNLKTI